MHKVDIKQRHRMPVLFQMILASILTFLVMSLLMFGFWILQHIKENNFQILMTELESVVHLILGIPLILLPIYMATILFIHMSKVFVYVMYSLKFIVLSSMAFLLINTVINVVTAEMYAVKTVLLFSCFFTVFTALLFTKVFHCRYKSFIIEINRLSIKPNITERLDMSLTIVISLFFLIPSLWFFFVFF